jgi:RNA polymerase sigma-70 factor, ECF subfamily
MSSEQAERSRRPDGSAPQANRLATLFEAHADRLYRLARRLTPSTDDALDLVQETFLKAARSPLSIPHRTPDEEAWLIRVLINVRRDEWRKQAVARRVDVNQCSVGDADPERAFVIRSLVWRALDSLPPRRRAVLVMYELEGLSVTAIAALLGVAAVTVRWHLARGRRELARQIRLDSGETDGQLQKSVAGRRPAPSRSTAP